MAKEPKKLSALDRAIQQAMGEGRSVGSEDDPARERWPNLWEWLARIYVGEDRMMQPGSISIMLGPEGAIATVSNRDLQMRVPVATPHLGDVFDALEKELAKERPNIQSWGKTEPRLRKRKSGN